ncbi:MAG TPA: glycosyltransferase family 39 protein [Blastocatellia bacterium]|nr:glycosyltransferase family 39 protein [Blastocatellia bacterium]
MYTTDQPLWGMVMDYDSRALGIGEGRGVLIPNKADPSDTSLLSRPPGYSILLGFIYALFGRNFFTVQLIHNSLDSLSPVLIFLIAGTLLGWRVGVATGMVAAVSHHLAVISNVILPDSLCVLPLLAGFYCLLRTERGGRSYYALSVLAGVMLGLSIWLRPNAVMLGPFFVLALGLISAWRWRAAKSAGVATLVSFLVVAPITIRNYVIYREFVPITDHLGTVLWEGIGEAGGERFGAVATDAEVGPQEAILYGDPRYAEDWSTPDGIKRDHDRIKKSLRIIVGHPGWFIPVALKRMERMLRYSRSGSLVETSTATSSDEGRTVPEGWQDLSSQTAPTLPGERLSFLRPAVRIIQRIAREAAVPFILIGALFTFATSRRRTAFILTVPLYYLLFQSPMHTEARYTAAMQYFLFIFAAVVWVLLAVAIWNGFKSVGSLLISKARADRLPS